MNLTISHMSDSLTRKINEPNCLDNFAIFLSNCHSKTHVPNLTHFQNEMVYLFFKQKEVPQKQRVKI